MGKNPLGMMKQAASMQRQMKKVQKQLAKQIVEETQGPVTVTACGDMSIRKISIDADALQNPDPARLESSIAAAVNGALSSAKKMAGSEMSKMTGGLGGLADLLG